jgi:hypothetical protein
LLAPSFVPNGPAQQAVIAEALASANLAGGDIQYVEARSEYWMLFVDSPMAGSRLMLAMSKDGIAWNLYPAPIPAPEPAWDDEQIYRSTFLYGDDGMFRVWYSASSRLSVRHVGYAEIEAGKIASR